MHFLDHNMKLLATVNPELLKTIASDTPKLKFKENIGFGIDENGSPFTVVVNVNDTVYVLEDNIKSDVSISDSWIPGINENCHTIVVYGFCTGIFLEKVVTKYPNKKVICIEPDKRIIWFAFHLRDMEKVIRNVEIWTDEEPHIVRSKITGLVQNPLSRGVQLMQISQMFPDYSNDVFVSMQTHLSDFAVMMNTKIGLVEKWYGNRAKNILKESVSISGLLDKFKNVPAILCGAGPSLKPQLETLKNLKDKAIIVAASTATEVLINNGVVPTFIAGIDADPITSGGLYEKLESDVPLLFDGQLAYNALEYKGKKFRFRLNVNKYEEILNLELPVIESGPSIGNPVLDILIKMGCNPILIVGYDMSYTDDKLYCDGTQFQEDKSGLTAANYMKLKNNLGEDCTTEPSFLSMRNWFENYMDRYINEPKRICDGIIQEMDKKNGSVMESLATVSNSLKSLNNYLKLDKVYVYNCTARGIPIKNIENKSLDDCIRFFNISKEYNFKAIIDEAYYKPGTQEPNYIDTCKINDLNNQLIDELEQIRASAETTKMIQPNIMNFKVFPLLMEFIDIKLYIKELSAELEEDKTKAMIEFMNTKLDLLFEAIKKLSDILKLKH